MDDALKGPSKLLTATLVTILHIGLYSLFTTHYSKKIDCTEAVYFFQNSMTV